jgi:homocysteine S-methyltransferase
VPSARNGSSSRSGRHPASFAEVLAAGPVVLDGGLATELEARGYDLSGHLWSAKVLADKPEAVADAHVAYYQAGAHVATSASYQASVQGYVRVGLSRREAVDLLVASVTVADSARKRVTTERPLLVAASVGPYGAMLADGSEYTGDYDIGVRELRRFHRPRLEVLAAAGADVLAIETIPCLTEVEALLAELDRLDGMPGWLSLSCANGLTRRGENPAEAFQMARGVDAVVAVGVNCTAPDDIDALLPMAATADRPVIVYPNSGEGWDAERRAWTGRPAFQPAQVRRWVRSGAAAVGGCCRVGPSDIAAIAREVAQPAEELPL